MDKGKERTRINKQIDKLSSDINALKCRLENDNFVKKAPPKIIEESTKTLREHQTLLAALEKGLTVLE
mgnify:CR=1 FL=1